LHRLEPSHRRRPGSARSSLATALLILLVAVAAGHGATPPEAARRLPAPVRELLLQRAQRLLADGEPLQQQRRLAGEKAPATLQVVVLLCEFADSLFYGHSLPDAPASTQSDFYYAAHDSLYYVHQFQDVADYYEAVSGGAFRLEATVAGGFLRLPQPMAWYGNDPERGEQSFLLARDAVALADPAIDFSRYDTVVLVHAGAGEETDILGDSPEQIYSSYLSPSDFAQAASDTILPEPYLATDDTTATGEPVRLRHVLILPENEFQDPVAGYGGYFGSLGVYCFEIGLRLGMLSLSDFTPPGRPDSQGIGEFGLMGYGLFVGAGYVPDHPCAFNKMLMGWLAPYEVDPAADAVWTLHPAESPGDSTLARISLGPSEYWLLEYRLQDPDGNRIFSFPGDLNGNNIPDFYDADSALGDGTPTGFFDPATDTRERLAGGEFDFFMSENSARAPGVKGAGSGIYIWHVDEGVVREAFAAAENLFNADPRRKAVDLEEADGIADLDRRIPTPYLLGGDDDAFRGEGNDTFAPWSDPGTESAGGAWTGIVVDRISPVVVDSAAAAPDGEGTVIRYADRMTFHCGTAAPDGTAPAPAGRVVLDGVDLGGSHLVAADLDVPPDGSLEIVACGDGGRIYVWRADLSPWPAAAPDGLLAIARTATGAAPRWNPPAAVTDVDGDGMPEIVVTAADGLYAFRVDSGDELADGDLDPVSAGLLWPLAGCRWPALVADDGVVAVEDVVGASRLVVYRWDEGGLPLDLPAEADSAAAPAVVWQGALVVPARGGAEDGLALVGDGAPRWLPLPGRLAGWRPVGAGERLLVQLTAGAALVAPDGEVTTAGWPQAVPPAGPVAPGFAYRGDDVFVLAGLSGAPATGWPYRPRTSLRTGWGAAAPDVVSAVTAAGERILVFPCRDGRLYLLDGRGRALPGSPLAGPGETAGTALLLDLDGDGSLELAAAGALWRAAGAAADSLPGVPVSEVRVWDLGTGGTPVWPMWGGDPRHAVLGPAPGPSVPGDGLLVGGVVCYPAPLAGERLHVRVEVGRACRLQAVLYDLEGEEVRRSPVLEIPGAGPAEIVLPVGDIAPGPYLCRLTATADQRREIDVAPVAIVR